ncbi:MAG TPA: hypothetical protein VEH62_05650 [Gemmatimonadales bacterium]|nr:hypothetical protein [Gemmatimonadales bacterium]
MAELHGAPLPARLGQGAALALAATAVRLVFDPHALTGLSFRQGALFFSAVALAGALAGAGWYATDGLRSRGGWRRLAAHALAVLALGAFAVAIVAVLF